MLENKGLSWILKLTCVIDCTCLNNSNINIRIVELHTIKKQSRSTLHSLMFTSVVAIIDSKGLSARATWHHVQKPWSAVLSTQHCCCCCCCCHSWSQVKQLNMFKYKWFSMILNCCPPVPLFFSVPLSVKLATCPSVLPSVRLSVRQSVCPSIRLSFFLSVCLSTFGKINFKP